jgi:hypothetical protein
MNDHLNNNCSPKDNTDLGVCFQLERYKYVSSHLPTHSWLDCPFMYPALSFASLPTYFQVSECRNRRNPPEKRNSIAIRRRLFVFSFLMSGLLNIYVKDVGKSQTSKATVLLDLFHRDTLASISVLEGTSIASHSRTKGSTAACQEAPPTILTATRPRKPTVHFNSR